MNISIVVPLYNKEKSILRCIKSILGQTYQNFELIIVNDGSTDDSLKLCQKILDPRVKIITQKNKGVSEARNAGMLHSTNEWIAFIDADDEWTSIFLQETVRLIEKYPGCVAYGSNRINLNSLTNHASIPSLYYKPFGWEGLFDDYFFHITDSHPIHSSSVVCNKEELLRVGGFPCGITIGEDVLTWSKLAANGKIGYINIPLSIYYTNTENQSSGFPEDYYILYLKFMELADGITLSVNKDFLIHYELLYVESLFRRNNIRQAQEILKSIEIKDKYKYRINKLKYRLSIRGRLVKYIYTKVSGIIKLI